MIIGKIYYDIDREKMVVVSNKISKGFYLADFGNEFGIKIAIITPITKYQNYVYIGKL